MRNGMEGFDGREEFDFAAGSVHGYRWWFAPHFARQELALPPWPSISAGWPGRLAGHTVPFRDRQLRGATGYLWPAGTAEADCRAILQAQRVRESVREPPWHAPPAEGCGCGFWAYWAHTPPCLPGSISIRVAGVIEGAGRTLIGELGFRCQRARILALYIPSREVFTETLRAEGRWSIMDEIRAPQATLRGRAAERAQILLGAMRAELKRSYPEVEIFATVAAMTEKYPPEEP